MNDVDAIEQVIDPEARDALASALMAMNTAKREGDRKKTVEAMCAGFKALYPYDQVATDLLSDVAIDGHGFPPDFVEHCISEAYRAAIDELMQEPRATPYAPRNGGIHHAADGSLREAPKVARSASRKNLHTWEQPDRSLLEDRRGELPEFPLDVLNTGWQTWASETSHGSGTTPAHVMVPLLGIASAVVGVARRIQVSRS